MFKRRSRPEAGHAGSAQVVIKSSFAYRDGQVPPLTEEARAELADLDRSRQEAEVGSQTLSLA